MIDENMTVLLSKIAVFFFLFLFTEFLQNEGNIGNNFRNHINLLIFLFTIYLIYVDQIDVE